MFGHTDPSGGRLDGTNNQLSLEAPVPFVSSARFSVHLLNAAASGKSSKGCSVSLPGNLRRLSATALASTLTFAKVSTAAIIKMFVSPLDVASAWLNVVS